MQHNTATIEPEIKIHDLSELDTLDELTAHQFETIGEVSNLVLSYKCREGFMAPFYEDDDDREMFYTIMPHFMQREGTSAIHFRSRSIGIFGTTPFKTLQRYIPVLARVSAFFKTLRASAV